MERYSHLQAMPNSPLTPLTPLSENTKFEFNFGGDGSLDMYINSVRQEHRVEQQQKKLLQHANRTFPKKPYALQPKRYSEEFLKIRDVFEVHKELQRQNKLKQVDTPKSSVIQITYTGNTPTPTRSKQVLRSKFAATPTNVRTPLKARNHNVRRNSNSKPFSAQQNEQKPKLMQQLLKANENRIFIQASPVAAKPLCPKVARILQQNGLSIYSELFQREEIDLLTFHLLKVQDLHKIGITNQEHCAILMQGINYAGQHLKKHFKDLSEL